MRDEASISWFNICVLESEPEAGIRCLKHTAFRARPADLMEKPQRFIAGDYRRIAIREHGNNNGIICGIERSSSRPKCFSYNEGTSIPAPLYALSDINTSTYASDADFVGVTMEGRAISWTFNWPTAMPSVATKVYDPPANQHFNEVDLGELGSIATLGLLRESGQLINASSHQNLSTDIFKTFDAGSFYGCAITRTGTKIRCWSEPPSGSTEWTEYERETNEWTQVRVVDGGPGYFIALDTMGYPTCTRFRSNVSLYDCLPPQVRFADIALSGDDVSSKKEEGCGVDLEGRLVCWW